MPRAFDDLGVNPFRQGPQKPSRFAKPTDCGNGDAGGAATPGGTTHGPSKDGTFVLPMRGLKSHQRPPERNPHVDGKPPHPSKHPHEASTIPPASKKPEPRPCAIHHQHSTECSPCTKNKNIEKARTSQQNHHGYIADEPSDNKSFIPPHLGMRSKGVSVPPRPIGELHEVKTKLSSLNHSGPSCARSAPILKYSRFRKTRNPRKAKINQQGKALDVNTLTPPCLPAYLRPLQSKPALNARDMGLRKGLGLRFPSPSIGIRNGNTQPTQGSRPELKPPTLPPPLEMWSQESNRPEKRVPNIIKNKNIPTLQADGEQFNRKYPDHVSCDAQDDLSFVQYKFRPSSIATSGVIRDHHILDPSKPQPFLLTGLGKLPAELREMIWIDVLAFDSITISLESKSGDKVFADPIFRPVKHIVTAQRLFKD